MITLLRANGARIRVDNCDADLLAGQTWSVASHGYIKRSVGGRADRRDEYMHRLVMARVMERMPTRAEFVDHVNGDKADNRRCNLRRATTAENNANQGGHRRRKCAFKGVARSGNGKRFVAYIRHQRRGHYLGTFDTEEEAATAHDSAAREFFGAFARLNFREADAAHDHSAALHARDLFSHDLSMSALQATGESR